MNTCIDKVLFQEHESLDSVIDFLEQLGFHRGNFKMNSTIVSVCDPSWSLVYSSGSNYLFTDHGKTTVQRRLELRRRSGLTKKELDEIEKIIYKTDIPEYGIPESQKKDPNLLYRGTTFGFILFQLYLDKGIMKSRPSRLMKNLSVESNRGSPLSTEPAVAIETAQSQSKTNYYQIGPEFRNIGIEIPNNSYLWAPVLLKFPRSAIKPEVGFFSPDFAGPEIYHLSSALEDCKRDIAGFMGLKIGDIGFCRLYEKPQSIS